MSESQGRDVHRAMTTLISVTLVVLGVAMIIRTIAAGGGPLALGVMLGVLFVLAGLGRVYVARRVSP